MKVAIYLRVSTQEQNLDNQRLPLIQYCKRMDWEYEVFEEKESTRKTRPIQWELYNRLLRKEFDGLVIYSFSRWARSTKELVEHMEKLVDKGIQIYSYSENIDITSSMGRAMLTIISAFAQLERDIIRERTLAGLNRARAQGKKLGRPKGKKSSRDLPLEIVKKLRGEGYDERTIAKMMETSRYRVQKAIKEIDKEKQGGFSNSTAMVELMDVLQ